MAENSHISWTDHTFNPWIGCTNVGPGCDHCYAEKLATTRLGVGWGNDAPRYRTKPGNWAKVRRWHNKADEFKAANGHYPRVFAASLADIFDNKVDPSWRADFWELVRTTPKLQWLIVTKRVGNVAKMLPADWGTGYLNVVLIITVVNQEEADRDIPKLIATPAAQRGLSIEPMLGPVDLFRYISPQVTSTPLVDWVITGGESKQLDGARPLVDLEAAWVREVDDQCAEAGVAHHFKQWGHTIPIDQISTTPGEPGQNRITYTKDKSRAVFHDTMGRALDGIEHNGFPHELELAA